MADRFWVGGTGTWDASSTANWSATSGGAPGASAPTSADNVFFNSLSGTGTCTTASGSASGTITLNTSTLGLTLGAAHAANGGFNLTLGTLNLNSNALTVTTFGSSNSNVRSIAFGASGIIYVTSNNTNVWATDNAVNLTTSGSKNVEFTYAGATGTRNIFIFVTGDLFNNTLNIKVSGGTDIVNITTDSSTLNTDFTGFSGTLTNTRKRVFGDLIISPTMTLTAGANVYSFPNPTGTQKITSNGVTFDFPLTFNGAAGTVQLEDNLTVGSTRLVTLTSGTLNLNDKIFSMGSFSSNANTRSIAFGTTGEIRVTGNNATVWSTSVATGFSYTGTSKVVATYAGAVGTRTLQLSEAGPSLANALNVFITGGTDTVNISTSGINNLDYTGFSGTMGTGLTIVLGNLTLGAGSTALATANVLAFEATSGTQIINTNGVVLDRPISLGKGAVGPTFSLQSNLTTGFTRTVTFNCGVLELNNNTLTTGIFSSSNTNVRSIAFGTGNITVTGNAATVWNTDNQTNFTYTGSGNAIFSYAGATGTRNVFCGNVNGLITNSINVSVTAGTDTFALQGSRFYKDVNLTGFAGSFTVTNYTIFGSFTMSSGATPSVSNNGPTFAATSPVTITTAGKTFDFPITFNGIGGTFAFQDALTQESTRNFTITNGTVQLKNGVTSTVGNFVANNSNLKFLQSTTPGSQATLSQAAGTVNVVDLTIRDINAVGGASWNAYTDFENTDAGNNDGWNFSLSPPYSTAELPITLRPFTQPRRF
jgi:hypothetical protein